MVKGSGSLQRMDHEYRVRVRTAAFRVSRVYPGAVGSLLCRELLSWEEFGYRFGGNSMIAELVETIMATPEVPAK